jgi:hypothetical protein
MYGGVRGAPWALWLTAIYSIPVCFFYYLRTILSKQIFCSDYNYSNYQLIKKTTDIFCLWTFFLCRLCSCFGKHNHLAAPYSTNDLQVTTKTYFQFHQFKIILKPVQVFRLFSVLIGPIDTSE